LNKLPFAGYPDQIITDLINLVSEMVNSNHIESFYISGTENINSIRKHSKYSIIELYESQSLAHSSSVGDILIKVFFEHDKNVNETAEYSYSNTGNYIYTIYLAIKMQK